MPPGLNTKNPGKTHTGWVKYQKPGLFANTVADSQHTVETVRDHEVGFYMVETIRDHEVGFYMVETIRDHEVGFYMVETIRDHEVGFYMVETIRDHEVGFYMVETIRDHEVGFYMVETIRDHEVYNVTILKPMDRLSFKRYLPPFRNSSLISHYICTTKQNQKNNTRPCSWTMTSVKQSMSVSPILTMWQLL